MCGVLTGGPPSRVRSAPLGSLSISRSARGEGVGAGCGLDGFLQIKMPQSSRIVAMAPAQIQRGTFLGPRRIASGPSIAVLGNTVSPFVGATFSVDANSRGAADGDK